jgi:superfamily I DNA/RNA helicase
MFLIEGRKDIKELKKQMIGIFDKLEKDEASIPDVRDIVMRFFEEMGDDILNKIKWRDDHMQKAFAAEAELENMREFKKALKEFLSEDVKNINT